MKRVALLVGLLIPGLEAQQLAHFHHLHFNSTDPQASVAFYSTRFNGEKRQYAGKDAIWTGKSWFLFKRAPQAAPSEIITSLYHLGWAGRDPKAKYQQLLDQGVNFETPLGDLFDLLGIGTPGRGYYAYAYGPDQELIELNGGNSDNFQHLHLLSDDPIAASQWYAKEFAIPNRGPAPSPESRFNHGLQVGPLVFLNVDGVLFAWFPTALAKGLYPKVWEGRTKLAPSQGRVLDHFAFSVDTLGETLARLEKDGVKVLERNSKSAFVQAPDDVRLELVESAPAALAQ